jgi:hypothetical protein
MLLRYDDPSEFNNNISNIQITGLETDKATIRWQTSLVSDTRVFYGLTTEYTDTFTASAMVTLHTAKLSGLIPGTTYHFKVSSQDEFGFTTESADSTFVTTQDNT